MAYGKLVDGQIVYVSANKVEKDGFVIYNPSEDVLNSVGIYKVKNVAYDGENHVENGLLLNYIGKPYEPTESEIKKQQIEEELQDTSKLTEALERMIAENGATPEDREMAKQRILKRDELGKLVAEDMPSGTYLNPVAWVSGMQIKAYTIEDYFTGDGFYQYEGEIKRCIKSGAPTSWSDTEYWEY